MTAGPPFTPVGHGGAKTLAGTAVYFAPFWTATTGRTHLVRDVMVVWRGGDATYLHPRLVVALWCRGLPPVRGKEARLSLTSGPDLCDRCIERRRLLAIGFRQTDEPLVLPDLVAPPILA